MRPATTIDLTQRAPEHGRETHEDQVARVGHVDDGAGGVVRGHNLGDGGEDGGAGDGRQKAAKRQNGDDDDFPVMWECVVDLVANLMVLEVRRIVGADMTPDMREVIRSFALRDRDDRLLVKFLFLEVACFLSRFEVGLGYWNGLQFWLRRRFWGSLLVGHCGGRLLFVDPSGPFDLDRVFLQSAW